MITSASCHKCHAVKNVHFCAFFQKRENGRVGELNFYNQLYDPSCRMEALTDA